jgi:hypothetical protein
LTAFVEPKENNCQTDYDINKTNDDKAQFDLIKGQLDLMTARFEDKTKELEYLKSQLAIKDQQLDKQAFSLQSVIQENSRLNVKLLPEAPGAKKPWWKIW